MTLKFILNWKEKFRKHSYCWQMVIFFMSKGGWGSTDKKIYTLKWKITRQSNGYFDISEVYFDISEEYFDISEVSCRLITCFSNISFRDPLIERNTTYTRISNSMSFRYVRVRLIDYILKQYQDLDLRVNFTSVIVTVLLRDTFQLVRNPSL